MKKYKSAIEIRRADSRVCIVPYVRTVIEDTENIEFIYIRQDRDNTQRGKTGDLAEILMMLEDYIMESILED